MRILLRYLYGQNIDDAIQNRQSLDDNNGEPRRDLNNTNQSSNLVLYKDLLKLSDRFELDHSKELMELRLSRLINRINMEDMKVFAETEGCTITKFLSSFYL
jgi:Trm5-related predicted tRNA methylase